MRSVSRVLVLVVPFLALAGCGPKGASVQEKRAAALQMKSDALAELYKKRPEAKAHIQRSPGYAVFSNTGSKILMLATGYGYGVAVDNRTGKTTYMRMVEAGGGVGIGIKRYKAVFVFNDRRAFDSFLNGSWQAGGDADAGAQYKDKGMGAGVALTTDQIVKPVTVYQFTEAGINLSAVATGTRYYPDEELN
jgi:lipid-binding SYLF domain-containing protein